MKNLEEMKNILKNEKLKYSDLEENITYLLCPDKNCDLFWKQNCTCICEYECPNVNDLKKILYIKHTNELIILNGDYSAFRTVDFKSKDGFSSIYFRNSERHRIMHHMPIDDRQE